MRDRIVVLVLIAALLVWSLAIPGFVRWRLEAALRSTVPAERITVRVRGRPDAILAGRIAQLVLDIRRAVVDGLPVEAFTTTLNAVELDSPGVFRGGPLRLRRVGGGQAALTLTQEGLQRFLEETKGLKGARVRLAEGLMTLEGAITVVQYEVRATMQGRFAIEEGRRVVLHVETLSISGVALPSDIANVLIAPLNPLLSVDQLPVPLRLLAVTVADGKLTLTAEPAS